MIIKRIHWIGFIVGVMILVVAFILFLVQKEANHNLQLFLIGIAIGASALPFIINLILENSRQEKINEMFLEFSRNLAESVNTGTPISKSIVNLKKKDYGPLSPYVEKLANQIALGIPINKALENFAYEVDSPVIGRAVTLISEAERAGGEINYILESSAKSIAEVEKLKKERRAAISSLVVQGYIIFFVFIGIMLVMQFKILPLVNNVASFDAFNSDISSFDEPLSGLPAERLTPEEISNGFLYLLITQGLFSGLIIGKLTEGSLKKGIKHSFALSASAFLISTGIRLMLSSGNSV